MAKTELFARNYNGRISPVYSEKQSAGAILFVSSVLGTDAAGYGGSPESPYATLGYAHTEAVTGTGGLIILMPGHAETVDTAAWLTITKANLTILGIGNGALIPTFTFEAGDAVPLTDINFDAANVTVKHVKFFNSEDPCTAPMDINAAHVSFIDCIFEDDGAAVTTDWFTLDANADHFLMQDCKHWGTDTDGPDSFISFTGACDHVSITGCHSHGEMDAANIELLAAATDILIDHNWLENEDAVDVNVEGFAACSGWVSNNMLLIPTDTVLTHLNTTPNLAVFENYGANVVGETGLLIIAAGVSV